VDFATVTDRFLAAARTMHQDCWWWTAPATTNKSIRRQLLRELLANYWAQLGTSSRAA
jgi:glutamate-1-semialdehyde 2,1-aminomutase